MPLVTKRSIQEQREDLARRRKELVILALGTTDLSELLEIALRFGELCDEEDALLHTRSPRR